VIAPRRLALGLALAALLALAGLFLGPFLYSAFIKPFALGAWYLLRVTALSLDQADLWAFLVLGLVIFLLLRLVSSSRQKPGEEAPFEMPNSALNDLECWRYMFSETPRDDREFVLVQRSLARLLVSVHAAKTRGEGGFELFDAFKQGRVPLPENIRSLVFGAGRRMPKGRFAAWLWRVSGRDALEYRRSLEDCLKFLETQLETPDERR
jgi:hypothetical protein